MNEQTWFTTIDSVFAGGVFMGVCLGILIGVYLMMLIDKYAERFGRWIRRGLPPLLAVVCFVGCSQAPTQPPPYQNPKEVIRTAEPLEPEAIATSTTPDTTVIL